VALVFDNRKKVVGPGVHVLLVGVSDYLNLPDHDEPPFDETWFLNKLTSAALSAFKIYETIQQDVLRSPLKTVRLLLSPSPVEIDAEPALETAGATRASRVAFERFTRDWRRDARGNPEDMTIFYFAGHGLQRGPEEGVLLLEDFLEPELPPLARCFEIGNIRNGMAPSPTNTDIALTQFYFADACLTRQETQKKFVNPQVPDVFAVELNVADRREAPMMFSTVDGTIALGRAGKPSHFSEALAVALQRAAEEPTDVNGSAVWPITMLTIKTALDWYYTKHQLGTQVKIGGVVGSPVIRYLPDPPDVDVSLQVRPDSLGEPCCVWVCDDNGIATAVPRRDDKDNKTQFGATVKAGIYQVQVDSARLTSNPYRSQRKFITQRVQWPWPHNLASLLKTS